MAETLYIIDGHAQFFRAYYAIRGGLNSHVTGEPTNMVYGYASMLAKLYRECRPDLLVLVIDAAGDRQTFRSDLYPQYKANRDPAPDDFHPQVTRCLELTKMLGTPLYAEPRVEADDVIATLVRQVRRDHPSIRIRIASRDKDLSQLLDEQTSLFDVQKGVEVTSEGLFESKGVRPEHIVDMLTLMGDAVDNVPGVPGIGPKTAAQLITTYGSLEGVLANLDALTPKRREAIDAAREVLQLSRSLVRLKDDCPVVFDPAQARADLGKVSGAPILEWMHMLGFGGLRDQWIQLLRGDSSTAPSPSSSPATPTARRAAPPAGGLFDEIDRAAESGGVSDANTTPPVREPDGEYTLIKTRSELEQCVLQLKAAASKGAVIGFDTETDGLPARAANLCGISLSCEVGKGVYIPVLSPDANQHLDAATVVSVVRELFESPRIPKTAHNAKFDLQVLKRAGILVQGLEDDTMILSAIVDPSRTSHALDSVGESRLGIRKNAITSLIGKGLFQRTFDTVPLEKAVPYAAADADLALRLRDVLRPLLTDSREIALYEETERPLISVIAEMEYAGIQLDREELGRQRKRLEIVAVELREKIVQSSPRPFNPDSPRQLADILFGPTEGGPAGLGLRIIKKTKTGPSTDSEVLAELASDPDCPSELPGLILEYRQVQKLVSTYLVALDQAVVAETGRIHASFHQVGAATGRLSSSDPNLQNIPIRTEMGRDIRKAFRAKDGSLLIAVDYSQVELRILAHLSKDKALCAAFHRGDDIHRAVASEVYGVALTDVTSEQRSAAKMVNFGIVYGITAHGLARRLGRSVSLSRAKEIIDGYRARFSGIDAFLRTCVDEAKNTGSVRTILGRRRAVPQIHSRNPAERRLGERVAINSVVQGSAADLIKIAMVRVHKVLREHVPEAQLLMQIHDELVVEAPSQQVEQTATLLSRTMSEAMELSVPLVAEAAWGPTWADC